MVDYYNDKMSGSDDESESQPKGLSKAELRRVNQIQISFFSFCKRKICLHHPQQVSNE